MFQLKSISGQVVDLIAGRIFPGTIRISDGRISEIVPRAPGPCGADGGGFLIPGLIDAHLHVESTLMVPSELARLAVRHGTVGTVSDPHEIANVLGVAGIDFMLDNAARVPFRFRFGAPSCVPATPFETSGACLGIDAVRGLLARPQIGYLSEVMNVPGVLAEEPQLMAKLDAAKAAGKPIDGHAPGLRGKDLERYVAAGIGTDHETTTLAEAEEKLRLGMRILIREGSAARDFATLAPLIDQWPEQVMFCSDDLHPDDLIDGHIDRLLRRAVALDIDPLHALRAATLNPIRYYRLDAGLLQSGDPADIVQVEDLKGFKVRQTIIAGQIVARDGKCLIERQPVTPINRFEARPKQPADFAVADPGAPVPVIVATDGSVLTGRDEARPPTVDGQLLADPGHDLLKLSVVNRYADRPPAVAWVRGFGLQRGAIASSVAHDSHNIVAVGCDDDALCRAVNQVIAQRGGLAVVDADDARLLPLPVAGIMSDQDGFEVAADYARIDEQARALGSPLSAPFMTLSFMALLVIPALKLSDQGLFDGDAFQLVDPKPGGADGEQLEQV